jgi:hypothetical protein
MVNPRALGLGLAASLVACGGEFLAGAGAGATSSTGATGAGGGATSTTAHGGAGGGATSTTARGGSGGAGGVTSTTAHGGAGGGTTSTGSAGGGGGHGGAGGGQCGDGIFSKGEVCVAPSDVKLAAKTAPHDVEVVDLDGDGALDLVVAARGTDHVLVLLGGKNGFAAPSVTVSTAPGARHLAVGPLHGAKDIVVSGTDGDQLAVHDVTITPGKPDVGAAVLIPLQRPRQIAMGTFGIGAAAGGFAVAVEGESGTGAGLFLFTVGKQGAFDSQHLWQPPAGTMAPTGLAALPTKVGGAPNALVVGSSTNLGLSVLTDAGKGFFEAPTVTPLVAFGSTLDLVTGDLDGDGAPDLVAMSPSGKPAATIFMQAPSGVLAAGPQIAILSKACEYGALGDLDGDADLDLAVSCRGDDGASNGVVASYLNDGHANFTTGPSFDKLPGPTGLRIADLNGDGRNDLVVAMKDGDAVTVFASYP